MSAFMVKPSFVPEATFRFTTLKPD